MSGKYQQRLDALIQVSSTPQQLDALQKGGIDKWADLASQFWRITNDGSCRLRSRNNNVTLAWLQGFFKAFCVFISDYLNSAPTEDAWLERGVALHSKRCLYVLGCFANKGLVLDMLWAGQAVHPEGLEETEERGVLLALVRQYIQEYELGFVLTQLYIVFCDRSGTGEWISSNTKQRDLLVTIAETTRVVALLSQLVPEALDVRRMPYGMKIECKRGVILEPKSLHANMLRCVAAAAVTDVSKAGALCQSFCELFQSLVVTSTEKFLVPALPPPLGSSFHSGSGDAPLALYSNTSFVTEPGSPISLSNHKKGGDSSPTGFCIGESAPTTTTSDIQNSSGTGTGVGVFYTDPLQTPPQSPNTDITTTIATTPAQQQFPLQQQPPPQQQQPHHHAAPTPACVVSAPSEESDPTYYHYRYCGLKVIFAIRLLSTAATSLPEGPHRAAMCKEISEQLQAPRGSTQEMNFIKALDQFVRIFGCSFIDHLQSKLRAIWDHIAQAEHPTPTANNALPDMGVSHPSTEDLTSGGGDGNIRGAVGFGGLGATSSGGTLGGGGIGGISINDSHIPMLPFGMSPENEMACVVQLICQQHWVPDEHDTANDHTTTTNANNNAMLSNTHHTLPLPFEAQSELGAGLVERTAQMERALVHMQEMIIDEDNNNNNVAGDEDDSMSVAALESTTTEMADGSPHHHTNNNHTTTNAGIFPTEEAPSPLDILSSAMKSISSLHLALRKPLFDMQASLLLNQRLGSCLRLALLTIFRSSQSNSHVGWADCTAEEQLSGLRVLTQLMRQPNTHINSDAREKLRIVALDCIEDIVAHASAPDDCITCLAKMMNTRMRATVADRIFTLLSSLIERGGLHPRTVATLHLCFQEVAGELQQGRDHFFLESSLTQTVTDKALNTVVHGGSRQSTVSNQHVLLDNASFASIETTDDRKGAHHHPRRNSITIGGHSHNSSHSSGGGGHDVAALNLLNPVHLREHRESTDSKALDSIASFYGALLTCDSGVEEQTVASITSMLTGHDPLLEQCALSIIDSAIRTFKEPTDETLRPDAKDGLEHYLTLIHEHPAVIEMLAGALRDTKPIVTTTTCSDGTTTDTTPGGGVDDRSVSARFRRYGGVTRCLNILETSECEEMVKAVFRVLEACEDGTVLGTHGAFETIGKKLMEIQAAYIRVVGDIRIELTATSIRTGWGSGGGLGGSLNSNGSNHHYMHSPRSPTPRTDDDRSTNGDLEVRQPSMYDDEPDTVSPSTAGHNNPWGPTPPVSSSNRIGNSPGIIIDDADEDGPGPTSTTLPCHPSYSGGPSPTPAQLSGSPYGRFSCHHDEDYLAVMGAGGGVMGGSSGGSLHRDPLADDEDEDVFGQRAIASIQMASSLRHTTNAILNNTNPSSSNLESMRPPRLSSDLDLSAATAALDAVLMSTSPSARPKTPMMQLSELISSPTATFDSTNPNHLLLLRQATTGSIHGGSDIADGDGGILEETSPLLLEVPPQLQRELQRVRHLIEVYGQCILNAATGNTTQTNEDACKYFGVYCLIYPFAAVKPTFLDLVPAFQAAFDDIDFTDAACAVIMASRGIDSRILLDFALGQRRSELLSSLQVPEEFVQHLPMNPEDPAGTIRFWHPICTAGPVRSELRFRGTGGLVVNLHVRACGSSALTTTDVPTTPSLTASTPASTSGTPATQPSTDGTKTGSKLPDPKTKKTVVSHHIAKADVATPVVKARNESFSGVGGASSASSAVGVASSATSSAAPVVSTSNTTTSGSGITTTSGAASSAAAGGGSGASSSTIPPRPPQSYWRGLTLSTWVMVGNNVPVLPLISVTFGEGDLQMSISIRLKEMERLEATISTDPKKKPTSHVVNQDGAVSSSFLPGNWTFVALVLDGATSSAMVYVYGRVIGTLTGIPMLNKYSPNATSLAAKASFGPVDEVLERSLFSLGEVRVWEESLQAPSLLSVMFGSKRLQDARKLRPIEAIAVEEKAEEFPVDSQIGCFTPHISSGPKCLTNAAVFPRLDCTSRITGFHFPPPRGYVKPRLLFVTSGGLRFILEWLQSQVVEQQDTHQIPTGSFRNGCPWRGRSGSAFALDMCAIPGAQQGGGGGGMTPRAQAGKDELFIKGLQIMASVLRYVTYLETVRPRLYSQIGLFCRQLGPKLRGEHLRCLLSIATEQVQVTSKQTFRVIINKIACEHLLGDVRLYASLEEGPCLDLLRDVSAMFEPLPNIPLSAVYARRNAEFVMGQRFTDRLIHGLMSCEVAISLSVQDAILGVARGAITCRGFPESLVYAVAAACGQLSMDKDLRGDRYDPTSSASSRRESRKSRSNSATKMSHGSGGMRSRADSLPVRHTTGSLNSTYPTPDKQRRSQSATAPRKFEGSPFGRSIASEQILSNNDDENDQDCASSSRSAYQASVALDDTTRQNNDNDATATTGPTGVTFADFDMLSHSEINSLGDSDDDGDNDDVASSSGSPSSSLSRQRLALLRGLLCILSDALPTKDFATKFASSAQPVWFSSILSQVPQDDPAFLSVIEILAVAVESDACRALRQHPRFVPLVVEAVRQNSDNMDALVMLLACSVGKARALKTALHTSHHASSTPSVSQTPTTLPSGGGVRGFGSGLESPMSRGQYSPHSFEGGGNTGGSFPSNPNLPSSLMATPRAGPSTPGVGGGSSGRHFSNVSSMPCFPQGRSALFGPRQTAVLTKTVLDTDRHDIKGNEAGSLLFKAALQSFLFGEVDPERVATGTFVLTIIKDLVATAPTQVFPAMCASPIHSELLLRIVLGAEVVANDWDSSKYHLHRDEASTSTTSLLPRIASNANMAAGTATTATNNNNNTGSSSGTAASSPQEAAMRHSTSFIVDDDVVSSNGADTPKKLGGGDGGISGGRPAQSPVDSHIGPVPSDTAPTTTTTTTAANPYAFTTLFPLLPAERGGGGGGVVPAAVLSITPSVMGRTSSSSSSVIGGGFVSPTQPNNNDSNNLLPPKPSPSLTSQGLAPPPPIADFTLPPATMHPTISASTSTTLPLLEDTQPADTTLPVISSSSVADPTPTPTSATMRPSIIIHDDAMEGSMMMANDDAGLESPTNFANSGTMGAGSSSTTIAAPSSNVATPTTTTTTVVGGGGGGGGDDQGALDSLRQNSSMQDLDALIQADTSTNRSSSEGCLLHTPEVLDAALATVLALIRSGFAITSMTIPPTASGSAATPLASSVASLDSTVVLGGGGAGVGTTGAGIKHRHGPIGKLLSDSSISTPRDNRLVMADAIVSVAVSALRTHSKAEATAVEHNTSLLLEHLVDVYAFISPKPKSSMATHCLHLIQVLSSNIISIFRKTASKKGARDHMLRASIIRLRGELLDTPTIASIAEMISSAHDNGFYSEARTSQLLFVAYHTWANVPVSLTQEEQEGRDTVIVTLFRAIIGPARRFLKTHVSTLMLNAVNTFEKVFQDDGIAFLAALKSDEVHKIINHGPPRHAMSPTFVKNFDEVTMSYQSDIQKGAEMVTNHTHMEIEFEGLLQQQETHYMRAFSSLVEDLEPLSDSVLQWLNLRDCVSELPPKGCTRHYYDNARNLVPFLYEQKALYGGNDSNTTTNSAGGGGEDGEVDDPLTVNALEACVNEEFITHMSIYIPPVMTRIPPYGISRPPWLLHSEGIKISRSAMTILQYVLFPDESLQFIANGFKVWGIESVPVLVVLTNATLKLFAFSRLTPDGDLIMAQQSGGEDGGGKWGDGEALGRSTAQHQKHDDDFNPKDSSNLDDPTTTASTLKKQQSRVGFLHGAASNLKRLQSTLNVAANRKKTDGKRDGAKVSRSLQALSKESPHRSLCWFYDLQSIEEVRTCTFVHQPVGVDIRMGFDDGPLLAIMDENLSLNSDARKLFIKHIKEACKKNQGFVVYDDQERLKDLAHTRQQWVQRRVSNYQYLLEINRAAGRAFKDWNQYPVFPWVLKLNETNCSADSIDLLNPSNYRDLSWPIHAQNPEIRAKLEEKYEMAKESDMVPYHHGTHYTSAAAVMYFLIRIQPYLTMSAVFQGGHLDRQAARLFRSLQSVYEMANTTEDCKEALPDFYGNGGAFLQNLDRAQLGALQTGEVVNHVALPKWARGSPRVLVETMRQALESDEVSNSLHKWVDLIFGSSQTGPAGIKALNIHPTRTYPEEVRKHLKEAVTPEDQHVIVNEVINFGQTPMRVFDSEHPAKLPLHELKGSSSLSVTKMILLHAKSVYVMKGSDVLMIPEHLRTHFASSHDTQSIKGFVTLKGGKVMTTQQYIVPVGQSHLCLCFTPRTGCFLYRFSLTKDSRGAGTVPFEAPFHSTITALAVMDRESVVFIGTPTGVVYCFTNDMFRFTPMLGSILQGHSHCISGFATSSSHSLLLSYTNSPDDQPILWRYMRRHAAFLTRLNLSDAFGMPSVAIGAVLDKRDGSAVVATAEGIAVFASDGCVLGSGMCPREATGAPMPAITSVAVVPTTEWVDNGTLVYLTGHEEGVLCVWRASRRTTQDMCDDICLTCVLPPTPDEDEPPIEAPPLITVSSSLDLMAAREEEAMHMHEEDGGHDETTNDVNTTKKEEDVPPQQQQQPVHAHEASSSSSAPPLPPTTPSKGFLDFTLVQRLDTGEGVAITAITCSPAGVIDLGYSNGTVRTAFPEPDRIRRVAAVATEEEPQAVVVPAPTVPTTANTVSPPETPPTVPHPDPVHHTDGAANTNTNNNTEGVEVESLSSALRADINNTTTDTNADHHQ